MRRIAIDETKRLYGVMNERLSKSGFLACDEYTIADMAVWPWIARFDWQSVDLNEFPNVRRWYLEILDRPRRGAAGTCRRTNRKYRCLDGLCFKLAVD